MNTNKLYNKSDEVVKLRQGMEMILREGVGRGNLGDSDYIKRALKRISNFDNYTIKTRLEQDSKIDNVMFEKGSRVVRVMEEDKNLFYIYKDHKDEIIKLYVNPYDLMTEKELENESVAEANVILMRGEWEHQEKQIRNKVKKRRLEALKRKNQPYF